MRGRGERMRKKAERRWTLMVVPHGSGSSRAVEVSQTFVKALVGIGSVVALTFLVLGVAAISRGVNITHSRALENENRLLADEIQRMRERMTVLRDTLHRFSEREQELRLLAGLTPTDATVQQAGIGGPAGTWSERDSLKALGPGGQQALAARLDVDALARRANILVRSLNEAYDSLSKNRALMAATPSIMPTKGWLTSAFARERIHPILHLARPHEGIDVTAPMGAEIEDWPAAAGRRSRGARRAAPLALFLAEGRSARLRRGHRRRAGGGRAVECAARRAGDYCRNHHQVPCEDSVGRGQADGAERAA